LQSFSASSVAGCSGCATGGRQRWRPASRTFRASSARWLPTIGPRRLVVAHPAAASKTEGAGLARDLAIDLGTANTLVYAKSRGIVLNEPTVIALNVQTQDVLAMGHQAWHMIGRTPGYIQAVRPLRKGAITDFEITQRMIRLLLQRAGLSRFQRPRVLLCVPSAITEVERRAVKEAARQAGAADAQLVAQPMAAAIGAGLPIHEPLGNMVVDIGGGTTETAMISLGGIVALQALRVGSFDIDAALTSYVRREYGMAIGERTAEEIKLAIGSAHPTADEMKAEVRGRDLMSGLPKTAILSPEEVREAIDEQVRAIVDSVVNCLGQAPPELAQDLILQGIHLVGGGGMLRGLDRRLSEETDLPVHLVDAPLECVVLGAGKCLEAFESLKVLFMGAER
jgi:rod shape-determining protein MreB